MDLKQYPKMVDGVESCVTYSSNEVAGVQTVKSAYEVSSCGMRLKYFMQHKYDPAARCMTFHLDYDRRSDVQALGLKPNIPHHPILARRNHSRPIADHLP